MSIADRCGTEITRETYQKDLRRPNGSFGFFWTDEGRTDGKKEILP
jgi:hypothetical protein